MIQYHTNFIKTIIFCLSRKNCIVKMKMISPKINSLFIQNKTENNLDNS